MFYTQNIDPSVTTQTFESTPPPPPPLDLLMDVETYNIGIEGIGEGNSCPLRVMFSINTLHIYSLSHNGHLFLCNQSLPCTKITHAT